jgi:DNA-binding transcriptional ArsR family regulator
MGKALKTLAITCEPPEAMRETVREWKKAMKVTPQLDERAELLGLLGNATRLRAFYTLERLTECCVCDLASHHRQLRSTSRNSKRMASSHLVVTTRHCTTG